MGEKGKMGQQSGGCYDLLSSVGGRALWGIVKHCLVEWDSEDSLLQTNLEGLDAPAAAIQTAREVYRSKDCSRTFVTGERGWSGS